MATVTVTSACDNGISQNFSLKDNGDHLRVASFSSYLDNGDKTFLTKLGVSTRSPPTPAAAASGDPSHQLSFGRKYNEERELGIFSAEKYFSGRMDEMETEVAEKRRKEQFNRDGKVDLPLPKRTFKSATPSTCSEASWNSRSALVQKDRSLHLQRQINGRKFFSNFVCNCVGKKSIDIDDKVGKNCRKIFDLREEPIFIHEPVEGGRQTRTILAGNDQNRLKFQYGKAMDVTANDKGSVGLKREDRFTFPIISPAVGTLTVGEHELEEEKERVSLEVFGSSHIVNGIGGSSNLHRRLPALNLNAIAGQRQIDQDVRTSTSVAIDDEDDLVSEASSDLFEIESFSSKGHHHSFIHHPQPSDSTPAFSLASDYDNQKKMRQEPAVNAKAQTQRQQPTSLLSCKSFKAVNVVVADAYRVSEKLETQRHRRLQSDSMAPLARFQDENRAVDFEFAHFQRGSSMHYASRSNSMDAAHSLYMR